MVSAVEETGVTSTFEGLNKMASASFMISGGMVAEKNRDWRFLGNAANNFLTSWINPMSNIRSASSKTKISIFRSEEHTSELQSRENLVCRLLLEKKKTHNTPTANRSVMH